MALMMSISSVQEKPRKSSSRLERRPWMLRDYLGEDMSSCSSNGFRTFPRRQCCVAVKNIIENEVIRGKKRNNYSKPQPKRLSRNRSVSSALQRASMAVINAVKLLPFNSSVNGGRNPILPRSFSKKLFKLRFWKKSGSVRKEEGDEIERWISSDIVKLEKYKPLDLSNDTTITEFSTTTSNGNSDGKSDGWSDITFSSDYLTASSENDAVEKKEKSPVKDEEDDGDVSKRVGVIAGDEDPVPVEQAVNKNFWNDEDAIAEKEQSSPVSILDFPDNNDDGSSSPFTLRLNRLNGTKERLKKKLGKFESLAALGLEPVNLESLISSAEINQDQSPKFSTNSCSTPSYILSSESESEEEEEDEEEKVDRLLNIVKAKIPSKFTHKFQPDNLLLDFFKENVTKMEDSKLLKAAEDWINGDYDKLIPGEVKKRETYIVKEMEGGRWAKDIKVEREEVGIDIGGKVFAYLMEELLVECCSY